MSQNDKAKKGPIKKPTREQCLDQMRRRLNGDNEAEKSMCNDQPYNWQNDFNDLKRLMKEREKMENLTMFPTSLITNNLVDQKMCNRVFLVSVNVHKQARNPIDWSRSLVPFEELSEATRRDFRTTFTLDIEVSERQHFDFLAVQIAEFSYK